MRSWESDASRRAGADCCQFRFSTTTDEANPMANLFPGPSFRSARGRVGVLHQLEADLPAIPIAESTAKEFPQNMRYAYNQD